MSRSASRSSKEPPLAPRRPARNADPAPGGPDAGPQRPAAARLVVALVRGFRGLHGQIRVELLTDRPEERFRVGTALYLEGTASALTIAEAVPVADGPGWWLRFAELASREAAESIRDAYLEIEAPAEEHVPGRWFFHELVGLAVRSTTGEELGAIAEIYRAGGAEVFVVRGPRGELDIPGVRGIVTDLAPDRGEMIVDLDALDMDARPVDDDDYVRPRDRRPRKQAKPKGPAQPRPGTGPVRKPGAKGPGRPTGSAPGTPPAKRPAKAPGMAAGTTPPPAPGAPAPDA